MHQLEAFTLPGVTVQPYSVESRTTHFDLECHIWERPDKAFQVIRLQHGPL